MIIGAVQRGNVIIIHRDNGLKPVISVNSGDTLAGWSAQGVTVNRRNMQLSMFDEYGHHVKTVGM